MKDEYELLEDINLLRDRLRLANVDQANTEAELNDLQGAYDAMKKRNEQLLSLLDRIQKDQRDWRCQCEDEARDCSSCLLMQEAREEVSKGRRGEEDD